MYNRGRLRGRQPKPWGDAESAIGISSSHWKTYFRSGLQYVVYASSLRLLCTVADVPDVRLVDW